MAQSYFDIMHCREMVCNFAMVRSAARSAPIHVGLYGTAKKKRPN